MAKPPAQRDEEQVEEEEEEEEAKNGCGLFFFIFSIPAVQPVAL